MKRECPWSTKTREVLGNPSPTALEISLDSRDFAQALPSRSCSGIEDGFANHLGGAAPIQKIPFKLTTGKRGQSPAWEDLLTAELLLRHLWSEEAHHLTLATLFEIWPPCQLLPTPEIQRKSLSGKLFPPDNCLQLIRKLKLQLWGIKKCSHTRKSSGASEASILLFLAHLISNLQPMLPILPTFLDILPAQGHFPTMHTPAHLRPQEMFHAEGQGNGNTRNNSGKSILTLAMPHANLKADAGLWDVQKFHLPPFVLSWSQ